MFSFLYKYFLYICIMKDTKKHELANNYIKKLIHSCEPIKIDKNIFWYYDEKFLRNKKLSRVLNTESNNKINLYKVGKSNIDVSKYELIFEIDLNKKVFNSKIDIWMDIQQDFNLSYEEIALIFVDVSEEIFNMELNCTFW